MRSRTKIAVAMTIAGSDPGGGAGIQADLKTFAALKVYGFSVLSAVIAQNSSRVARVDAVAPDLVAAQIETLVGERSPDALKTGALASGAIVEAVASAIRRLRLPAPVVDPVLLSTSGARLLDVSGEEALRTNLFPLARLVTPNIPEAEALSGIVIDGSDALRAAARALHRLGTRAVLIKGGHMIIPTGSRARRKAADGRAVDVLFDGRNFVQFASARVAGETAHGSGCALSAAIAAWLARGADLETAVRRAKRFVSLAMHASFVLGAGRPLLDHFARP